MTHEPGVILLLELTLGFNVSISQKKCLILLTGHLSLDSNSSIHYRKGIREYSDGLVDLEINPNHEPPPSNQDLMDQKSPDSGIDIDVVTVDQDDLPPTDLSEVDFPTKCPHCPSSTEEIYLTEPSLEAHCRVAHGYKCPSCHKMTGKKSDMLGHFEKDHCKLKPFFCDNCTVVFISFHDRAGHNCKKSVLQDAASMLEAVLMKVKAWSPSLCPFCPTSQNLYQTPQGLHSIEFQ